MNATLEAFRQAARIAGIDLPGEIIADSALHRFTIPGDKSKSENGWYVCHADDPVTGAFGCWKRQINEKWCCKSYQTMTTAEKTAYTNNMEAVKQARDAERERIQAECGKWCASTWEKAKAATNENPYLKKKDVNAYGLKSFKDSLLVPVQDLAGTIHGIQFIAADGTKKFKTGTNKTGHFFKIGKSKDNTIIICEGYATGASIHQATGHAVVIAFDAGNLLSVSQGIRSKFPDIKIIIAADNDTATEGNPGLTKATGAAKAVNGLLAIPAFLDTSTKPTDFNDLHRLEGLEQVKRQIEAAHLDAIQQENAPIQENPLDAAIQRLAALSPLQYDQVRKDEAKALNVRPSTLDAAVKSVRKSDFNESPFEDVEPCAESVDGAVLLTTLAATIRRFIICELQTAQAVALWIAMTWFIDVVQVAPLAVITAPEKRCGKSLLLFLIGRLVPRPLMSSSISPSALFRSIDAWQPTLLIDEVDACLKDNEELRGLINCGHTRDSAFTIRCVGDDHTPKKFNVWGAKALSGIGHVADTLMDRSIILELRRKLTNETVDRIRHAEPGLFNDLCSKLARFAEDNSERVRLARPDLPSSLNDRAQDNWEPLLAIATVAGGDWFKIGTAAALKLSGGESLSLSIGTELLVDIQSIFKEMKIDRFGSSDLIKHLCAEDEKPWASYNRGLPIKPRQIAAKLKEYGILSKTIRIGYETAKGYESKQFTESFSRYIPSQNPSHVPSQNILNVTTSQPDNHIVTDNPSRYLCESVNDTREPLSIAACDVVTDKNPFLTSEVIDLTGIDFEVTI